MIMGEIGELATEHEAPISQIEKKYALKQQATSLTRPEDLGEHEIYPLLGCCLLEIGVRLVSIDPNDRGHCWVS